MTKALTKIIPDEDGLLEVIEVPQPVAAPPAVVDDERNLGPAMAALRPRQREFVEGLINGLSMSEAYRQAGYKDTKAVYTARAAARLGHSEPIIAALQELTKSKIRLLAPKAITALTEILGDRFHKDRLKAVENILGRLDPQITRVDQNVRVEVVDHTAEAVEQLRMLKQLGVTREKLEEMFGFSGLGVYERILAEQDAKAAENAKLIDGEIVESDDD